jgi:iron complex transport system substrate-binding protein
MVVIPACSGGQPAQAPAGDSSTSSVYPVTIENCGQTLTVDQAPRRVIATDQSVAEILVALGLQQAIVGMYHGISYPPREDLADDLRRIRVLSKEGTFPSREVALSVRPDFVVAAYPQYDFDASSGAASRQDFRAAGAQIFGGSTQCTPNVTDAGIDSVYGDILNLGRIFNVQARAQAIVDGMRQSVADVEGRVQNAPSVRVAFYDGGKGPLGVIGSGIFSELIRRAGGSNVFGSTPNTYMQVSTEEFAATNPDLFAVTESHAPGVPSAAEKLEFLFRTFPQAPASRNRRSVVIGAQYAPGIRSAEAVELFARGFHPDLFK